MSREHAGECAFAGAVRPHDGVHLAGVDRQIDAAENLASADAGMEIPDLQQQPTLPSVLTLSSFCASTANSIGSWRKTSLQKPLTIMLTASSVDSPRCRQ